MAEMSSWPSQSIEMAQSQLCRHSMRPASRAFWWPRLRESDMPRKRGSRSDRPSMISQVRSREPSFTSSTWLAGSALPLPTSSSSSAANSPLVTGRTSCSL